MYIFQIDCQKRMRLDSLVSNIPALKKAAQFLWHRKPCRNQTATVSEHTQASVNVMKNLEELLDSMTFGTFTNSLQTNFHYQGDSSLCYGFAIISCLRHVILQFVKSSNVSKKIKNEIVNACQQNGNYHKSLAIWVGNVCPRSFEGLFPNCPVDSQTTSKQTAVLETAIQRLTWCTAFECNGWKRLLPIRQIFKQCKLDIDNFDLTYKKVCHQEFKVSSYHY